MSLRKLLLCWWGGCGMMQVSDKTHIWAECPLCGKVAAKISRAEVRAYIDGEWKLEYKEWDI